MDRILRNRIPEKITRNTELDPLISELKQEVVGDYDFSVRKSIGEFYWSRTSVKLTFFQAVACKHTLLVSVTDSNTSQIQSKSCLCNRFWILQIFLQINGLNLGEITRVKGQSNVCRKQSVNMFSPILLELKIWKFYILKTCLNNDNIVVTYL